MTKSRAKLLSDVHNEATVVLKPKKCRERKWSQTMHTSARQSLTNSKAFPVSKRTEKEVARDRLTFTRAKHERQLSLIMNTCDESIAFTYGLYLCMRIYYLNDDSDHRTFFVLASFLISYQNRMHSFARILNFIYTDEKRSYIRDRNSEFKKI